MTKMKFWGDRVYCERSDYGENAERFGMSQIIEYKLGPENRVNIPIANFSACGYTHLGVRKFGPYFYTSKAINDIFNEIEEENAEEEDPEERANNVVLSEIIEFGVYDNYLIVVVGFINGPMEGETPRTFRVFKHDLTRAKNYQEDLWRDKQFETKPIKEAYFYLDCLVLVYEEDEEVQGAKRELSILSLDSGDILNNITIPREAFATYEFYERYVLVVFHDRLLMCELFNKNVSVELRRTFDQNNPPTNSTAVVYCTLFENRLFWLINFKLVIVDLKKKLIVKDTSFVCTQLIRITDDNRQLLQNHGFRQKLVNNILHACRPVEVRPQHDKIMAPPFIYKRNFYLVLGSNVVGLHNFENRRYILLRHPYEPFADSRYYARYTDPLDFVVSGIKPGAGGYNLYAYRDRFVFGPISRRQRSHPEAAEFDEPILSTMTTECTFRRESAFRLLRMNFNNPAFNNEPRLRFVVEVGNTRLRDHRSEYAEENVADSVLLALTLNEVPGFLRLKIDVEDERQRSLQDKAPRVGIDSSLLALEETYSPEQNILENIYYKIIRRYIVSNQRAVVDRFGNTRTNVRRNGFLIDYINRVLQTVGTPEHYQAVLSDKKRIYNEVTERAVGGVVNSGSLPGLLGMSRDGESIASTVSFSKIFRYVTSASGHYPNDDIQTFIDPEHRTMPVDFDNWVAPRGNQDGMFQDEEEEEEEEGEEI